MDVIAGITVTIYALDGGIALTIPIGASFDDSNISDEAQELFRRLVAAKIRAARWAHLGDRTMIEVEGFEEKSVLARLKEIVHLTMLSPPPQRVHSIAHDHQPDDDHQ